MSFRTWCMTRNGRLPQASILCHSSRMIGSMSIRARALSSEPTLLRCLLSSPYTAGDWGRKDFCRVSGRMQVAFRASSVRPHGAPKLYLTETRCPKLYSTPASQSSTSCPRHFLPSFRSCSWVRPRALGYTAGSEAPDCQQYLSVVPSRAQVD